MELTKILKKMTPHHHDHDHGHAEGPEEKGEGSKHTCHAVYHTKDRKDIKFSEICDYLKNKEISCQKYNYSLEQRYQNQDHYIATLQLSKCGKKLLIYNLKPEEYQDNVNQFEEVD